MKRIDIQRSKFIKIMPYGLPGSGKTYLCGTFANDDRTAPVLHLDCAGNFETLDNLDRQPDVIQIDSITDLNVVHDWLFKKQPAQHPLVREFNIQPGYKTVSLDCGTDLQRLSFRNVMKEESLQIADTPRSPEFGDWRAVLAQMTQIAYKLFKLEMHIVMTAWEREDTDKITGATRYRPFFTGQSIDAVPGYALAVGRMLHKSRVDNNIRKAIESSNIDFASITSVIIFQPSQRYDAKDQNGFNVPFLVDPSADQLLDLMKRN